MNKLCYVTSFLDIGRGDWQRFRRTIDEYLEKFRTNLFHHFETMDEKLENRYELVIYLDKDLVNRVHPTRKNVQIIGIDDEYLRTISPLWQRLDREQEIVESESYRTRFRSRLCFPENSVPKYSLINHAKIDFLVDAQKRTDSEYFCWVDFGYLEIPKNPIDIELLNKDKINYNLINPLDEKDKDVIYTMLAAPERIGGGFFFGNRKNLQEYQKLYHDIHFWFQSLELVDDDQHLVLRCYYERPNLFHLHNIGGWFRMLSRFQIR